MNPEQIPSEPVQVTPETTPPIVPVELPQPLAEVSAIQPSKKKFPVWAIILIIVTSLLVFFILAAVAMVTVFRKDPPANDQVDSSFTDKSALYDAECLTMKPVSGLEKVKFTSTSRLGKVCSFIVQYEGLGDSPIAVGEVFSGDYPWQEKADFIPNALRDGYELDLLDLGLLRTGKGSSMTITDKKELTIDGSRAILFTHGSNRSISGSAYSAVVETPATLKLDETNTSSLFIWGVANQANGDLMEQLIDSIEWQ